MEHIKLFGCICPTGGRVGKVGRGGRRAQGAPPGTVRLPEACRAASSGHRGSRGGSARHREALAGVNGDSAVRGFRGGGGRSTRGCVRPPTIAARPGNPLPVPLRHIPTGLASCYTAARPPRQRGAEVRGWGPEQGWCSDEEGLAACQAPTGERLGVGELLRLVKARVQQVVARPSRRPPRRQTQSGGLGGNGGGQARVGASVGHVSQSPVGAGRLARHCGAPNQLMPFENRWCEGNRPECPP